MTEKDKIGLDQANRIDSLRQVLNKLTGDIVIDEDEALREIQMYQRNLIIENLGVLLVHTDLENKEIATLWNLVEPHMAVLEQEKSPEELDQIKQIFSAPLSGKPNEILTKTGLGNKNGPINTIIGKLRGSMTQDQQVILPIVTGRTI